MVMSNQYFTKMVRNQNPVKLCYRPNKIIFVILAIIFVNFSVGFCASVNVTLKSSGTNICTTSACSEAAKSIIQNMNTTKDPCNNFYLFACGKFVKEADVPRGQPYTSPLKIIENEVQEKLRDDLEQSIEDNEPRTFQLLKSHYSACLKSGTEEDGSDYESSVYSVLEGLGGWPVVKGEAWNESAFDWMEFMKKVHQYGLRDTVQPLFDLSKFEKNGTKYIKIDRPETGLDRDYLKEGIQNEEVKEYYDRMVNISIRYGAEESEAKKELEKSLKFEIELANIPQHLKLKQFFTVKRLENRLNVPWYNFLNQFQPQDIELDPNQKVSLDREQLRSLLNLIRKTDKRTIANYALWRVVYELDTIMDIYADTGNAENFRAPKTGHYLWKHCIDYLMNNMPVAMGALYVRKNFDQSSRTAVQDIATRLIKNFQRFVSESKSMNDLTKQAAQKKLDAMHIGVAFPDELVDDEKLDDYYRNLNELDGNFFDNHLALLAFNYHDKLERNSHAYSRNNWVYQSSVAVPNAEMNYKRNSMMVNAAIIQKEFFDANVPNYLNYAGIGKAIGHEMTHDFDNHGSKFDEKGKRVDWWDEKALEEFENGKQCLTEQYNNYKASKREIALDGDMMLQENIADQGGIKVAYTAYEEWVKQNGEEPGLPGLPYTSRQLFWLNVAHTECHRIRKAGWDQLIEDEHPPGPFRILGALANTPEFARDFSCPAGSRMNPTKKCLFWWNS